MFERAGAIARYEFRSDEDEATGLQKAERDGVNSSLMTRASQACTYAINVFLSFFRTGIPLVQGQGGATNGECSSAQAITLPFDGNAIVSDAAVSTFSNNDCSVDTGNRLLWYSFTAGADNLVRATVTNLGIDGQLAIFSGSSCAALTCVDADVSDFNGLAVEWAASSSGTYYVVVVDESSSAGGSLDVDVQVCLASVSVCLSTNPANLKLFKCIFL